MSAALSITTRCPQVELGKTKVVIEGQVAESHRMGEKAYTSTLERKETFEARYTGVLAVNCSILTEQLIIAVTNHRTVLCWSLLLPILQSFGMAPITTGLCILPGVAQIGRYLQISYGTGQVKMRS